MPRAELIPVIDDDWTVWAFSDPHGVTSGFVAALREAGLLDAGLHWSATPRTALVGCGDYIDRGMDTPGLVTLLRRLEVEAADGGGRAVFARGNHEQTLLHIGAGHDELLETWLFYGGQAMLDAYGCPALEPPDPGASVRAIEAAAPGILGWMAAMPQAVRWRDVLFVHGGLPPWSAPGELGLTTEEHLTIRSDFFETPWSSEAFHHYEREGIGRVVFGHTPGPDGPRILQGGRLLCLDSNAAGSPQLPPGARSMISLVRLEGSSPFDRAPLVLVATDDAPERAPR
jgi:hypothetical protein